MIDFILPALIVAMLALGAYGYRCEKREWNNGICKESGRPWVAFDMDSSGATGYVDDPTWRDAKRTLWISYESITKGGEK